MRHVPIGAFKDKVSEYVSAAEAGEEVVITRHGRVTARLVPPVADVSIARQRAQEAFDDMAEARRRMRSKGLKISPEEWVTWKNEGRR